MSLTDKELSMIEDKDFLITKIKIISEIENLMRNTKDRLLEVMEREKSSFLSKPEFNKGKVYKGEYYRELPFVTLDFPSIFTKENVFAYRTMFWWGNFFSATLHLQGEYLDIHRAKFLSSFDMLLHQDIYICVGETPWEYHYGKENYVKLSSHHKEMFENSSFIKLSKRIPLEQIDSVPQISSSFFLYLASFLNK
ncbi:MAG: hypothetical protein L3J41_04255 [Melioribacteraceae bacterium]|nr:hypothetical protein [Melioribacteraceae bacterium]